MHTEELVSTFELSKPDICVPMKRAEFYADQIVSLTSNRKPTKAVGIVDVFLFDTEGEIFIQKRSNSKTHNPGLFDKTIGGHMQFGDDPTYTVMVETVQEMQVPSICLYTDEDFKKTFTLLRSYLETVAVIKHVATFIDVFQKQIDGAQVPVVNKKYLYFGVYNGSVKTVDRESKGVLLYTLDDLQKEMMKNPHQFTHDLHFYLENYGEHMKKFVSDILSSTL